MFVLKHRPTVGSTEVDRETRSTRAIAHTESTSELDTGRRNKGPLRLRVGTKTMSNLQVASSDVVFGE